MDPDVVGRRCKRLRWSRCGARDTVPGHVGSSRYVRGGRMECAVTDDSEMDGHDLGERRGEEADHPGRADPKRIRTD